MVVILDHAADRDVQAQLLQDLGRDVDLSASAVHEDEIGKTCKAAQFHIEVLFLHLLLLLQPVAEAPGQDLVHAGIIIGAGNRFDAEFAVVTALGFAVFIDHHGSDIGKSADVGNIVGFHTADRSQSQQIRDLFRGSYGASLFTAQTFAVLLKDK